MGVQYCWPYCGGFPYDALEKVDNWRFDDRGLLVTDVSTGDWVRHTRILLRLFVFGSVELAENERLSPSSSVSTIAPSASLVSKHFPSMVLVFRSLIMKWIHVNMRLCYLRNSCGREQGSLRLSRSQGIDMSLRLA